MKSEISKNCQEYISLCAYLEESHKNLVRSCACTFQMYARNAITHMPVWVIIRDAKAPHPCKTLHQKCSIKSCHTIYQCNAVCMCWAEDSNCLLPSQLQDRCLQHVPEAGKIYVVRCSCSNDRTCSVPLWSATAPSTAILELPPIPWRRASLSPGKVCIAP